MRENSVRLRLTQSEISRLAESGRVEQRVDFGADLGGAFSFVLELEPGGSRVLAAITGGRLSVSVPRALAMRWIETEQVGIEAEQETAEGARLKLVIEKDFACLKPRPGEDDSDSFPNPLEGADC